MLERELLEGTYQSGAYHYFFIHDPKTRQVAAAPFRDRVVHHALVRVLEPLFERRFIEDSYACRKGRGNTCGNAALSRVATLHVSRAFQRPVCGWHNEASADSSAN